MPKQVKVSPEFRTEVDERAFWERHVCSECVDLTQDTLVRLPNMRPSTTTISLRLPLSLLEQIKVEAHKRDVPYQSPINIWLAEHLAALR